MITGIFLILMGILILAEPRILVAMIAGFFIASGVAILLVRWRLKKVYRAWENAQGGFNRFIIRF